MVKAAQAIYKQRNVYAALAHVSICSVASAIPIRQLRGLELSTASVVQFLSSIESFEHEYESISAVSDYTFRKPQPVPFQRFDPGYRTTSNSKWDPERKQTSADFTWDRANVRGG